MSAPTISKDPEHLRMTVTTELDASVERAWELWADPRQLERWWGPPGYPATFVDHDLATGARVTYFMSSPEGEKFHGWWQLVTVEAPHRIELQDGFADEHGAPKEELPVSTMVVTLTEGATGTIMQVETRFPSLEAMEQLVSMGMDEGIAAAIGQIPAILSESAA